MSEGIKEVKLEELENVSGGTSYTVDDFGRRYVVHKVVKGDTLGKLARKYRTTISACMAANPIIKNKNLIKIGWTLRIPYHWS